VQVRSLRAEGQSAKAIARLLGVGTADVVGMLNAAVPVSALERAEPRCWINAGWSRSVEFDGAAQWAGLDPGASDAEAGRGLVSVLVALESARSSKAQVAGFLLDVWCLGVKNALPPEPMTTTRLTRHRVEYFGAYEAHVQVPAELARALVFGAVDYARSLGFEPEADFDEAAAVLGEPIGPNPIRFGREGKPFYINGPYDDSDSVLATLRRAVGDGGFDYSIAFPEQQHRSGFVRIGR
jgi:hypothetical protein